MASRGEDGTRRAEKVRQISGKTFHLLRCLRTGKERCLESSTSALPPRQPLRQSGKNRGGAGGESGSTSRTQEEMIASLLASDRTAGSSNKHNSKLRTAPQLPCGWPMRAYCPSECRTEGRLCPLRGEVELLLSDSMIHTGSFMSLVEYKCHCRHSHIAGIMMFSSAANISQTVIFTKCPLPVCVLL